MSKQTEEKGKMSADLENFIENMKTFIACILTEFTLGLIVTLAAFIFLLVELIQVQLGVADEETILAESK